MLDSEEEVEHTITPDVTRAKARLPRSQVKSKNNLAPFETAKPRTKRPKITVKEKTLGQNVPVAAALAGKSGGLDRLDRLVLYSKLPDFMRAGWVSALLPTLYDSLGRSQKPFEHYCKGPEVIKKLQAAVNVVWPGTDYKMKWTDDACLKVNTCILQLYLIVLKGLMPPLQAVDRLNEKRSWFGSNALETIDKFFNGAEFINKPEAIKTYALWATRGDGPALYATPTPIHVTVPTQDLTYIVCCLRLHVTTVEPSDTFHLHNRNQAGFSSLSL
jgi:hypothetical protein